MHTSKNEQCGDFQSSMILLFQFQLVNVNDHQLLFTCTNANYFTCKDWRHPGNPRKYELQGYLVTRLLYWHTAVALTLTVFHSKISIQLHVLGDLQQREKKMQRVDIYRSQLIHLFIQQSKYLDSRIKFENVYQVWNHLFSNI